MAALKSGKIECRVYRKEKFHAKAYITHGRAAVVGSFALVGSSNFTFPGLSQNIDVVALQAVDYFLWALQRLYEPRVNARSGESLRSERFFGVLRAQVAEVHDLSFGPGHGTFFTRQRELTVATRFGTPEGPSTLGPFDKLRDRVAAAS